AVACYQQALQIQPEFSAARINLNNVLHQQNRAAAGPSAAPADPEVLRNMLRQGVALAEQGRLDEAAACFLQAQQLQPNSVDAHNNLGSVRFGQQRYDEAVACYEHVLRLSPDYAAGHYNLGAALERVGRLQESALSYERALQID